MGEGGRGERESSRERARESARERERARESARERERVLERDRGSWIVLTHTPGYFICSHTFCETHFFTSCV